MSNFDSRILSLERNIRSIRRALARLNKEVNDLKVKEPQSGRNVQRQIKTRQQITLTNIELITLLNQHNELGLHIPSKACVVHKVSTEKVAVLGVDKDYPIVITWEE